VGQAGDTDEVQPLHGGAHLTRRRHRARKSAQPALVALGGDQHVLQHGDAGEDTGELEGSANAQGEDPVGALVGDVAVLKEHRTLIGLDVAGHNVKEGGLARTVGSDQSGDAALLHLERTEVEGLHAAEGARDTGGL
jgi:hypothetical protein